MQLRAGALTGPEAVAGGQRPVQRGGRPARGTGARRCVADRAFGQVHAGDAAWRVVKGGLLAELLRHLRPHRGQREEGGGGEDGQYRQRG